MSSDRYSPQYRSPSPGGRGWRPPPNYRNERSRSRTRSPMHYRKYRSPSRGDRRPSSYRRSRSPPARKSSDQAFTGDPRSRFGDVEFSFNQTREYPQLGEGDSYRPSYRRHSRSPPPRFSSRNPPRGPRADRGRNINPLRRKPFVPLPAHDRPILNGIREKTPELLKGMSAGAIASASDPHLGSEENDESSQQEPTNDERDEEAPDEDNGAARPASVAVELPETEKKRMDVISMIREAKAKRVEKKRDAVADNDDFISLEVEMPGEKPSEPGEADDSPPEKKRKLDNGRPQDAVPGDRPFSHRENFYGPYVRKDTGPPGVGNYRGAPLSPPPTLALASAEEDLAYSSEESLAGHSHLDEFALREVERGKIRRRKRKYGQITDSLGEPEFDARVTREWAAEDTGNPTPWCTEDHGISANIQTWLHKEIVDFLNYIRPKPFENELRLAVIALVRECVKSLWPEASVYAFGSFLGNLHLTTSDVDLVIISETFKRFKVVSYNKRALHNLANHLRQKGIAEDLKVIANARVPIIKFTEPRSGINIDIGFENDSGLIGSQTYQEWAKDYPACPPIVLLVKHFLHMRGMNEVYQGGLGSYAVSCMVVSLLQLLPGVQNGHYKPEKNLGLILLEFLDLYSGERLNMDEVGLRVDEMNPGYFQKPESSFDRQRRKPQIYVQDPNDPDNDITKSSYQIGTTFKAFNNALKALVKRMGELEYASLEDRKGHSILGCILGGNYREIEVRREKQREAWEKYFRPAMEGVNVQVDSSNGASAPASGRTENQDRSLAGPRQRGRGGGIRSSNPSWASKKVRGGGATKSWPQSSMRINPINLE